MKALSLIVGSLVIVSLMGAVTAPPTLAPLPPAQDLRQQLQDLKPGQFLWYPQVSPAGPVTVVVSLTEQRAYVYRNGIAIGVSTISSGKKGKETPTGVFSILQKSAEHKSDLYNSAPMPYMQRLTWDGIALHAGHLPGYPASHGCVRLPIEFAKKLFETTGFSSTTVIVSDAHSAPVEVYHPGLLAPTVSAGKPVATAVLSNDTFWNDPGDSAGPLSVLISRADLRTYVFRGGQLVGSAPVVALDSNQQHQGMAVFSLLEKPSTNELLPAQPLHWSAIQVSNPEYGNSPREQLGSLNVDPDFLKNLHAAMDIGTTLVITDLASTSETRSNGNFTVITTEAEKAK
ncbi:L,D-transpeptidase [Pseudomonas sp. GV071]|uniref:L,D-transpeptidase n=1 Tax=Pseudomonas sp. GV071 TaxID=2135754 RepID=UPI000D38DCB2|nr:L,D-transpeptidase [Pseudomonas sp. GV071]PTQ66885.1 lipoprotein-anchoring transpeptidase ErfK/SrfK [Pseudomonas sp. GV071]